MREYVCAMFAAFEARKVAARARLGVGALALAALLGAGCSEALDAPDLPQGWSGAARIAELTQSKCQGDAYSGLAETVAARAEDGAVAIDYGHAHFRCAQDVEGFVRRGDGALDVLVQPIDMDPSTVARCDCLYDVTMRLPVASGAYVVTVYRRWDSLNDNDTPKRVGEASVSVP